MAISNDNLLTRNSSGKIGKKVVMKQTRKNSLATAYPDRSNVVLSSRQKKSNAVFSQAVAYAQGILNDPVLKLEFQKLLKSTKKNRDRAVYNAAIQKFMLEHQPAVQISDAVAALEQYRATYPISDRQGEGLKYLVLGEELSNKVYQQLNKVSKATATRDLQDLVRLGIISATGRGAGARYTLLPIPS